MVMGKILLCLSPSPSAQPGSFTSLEKLLFVEDMAGAPKLGQCTGDIGFSHRFHSDGRYLASTGRTCVHT